MIRSTFLACVLFGLCGIYAKSAGASSIAVLCSGDFKGESSYVADCIDALAWSWGGARSVTIGPRPTISPTQFSDFAITKYVDASSEDLLKLLNTGTPLVHGLEFREYADCTTVCSTKPFLVVKLRNAFITGTSTAGSGGEEHDVENVTFAYTQISYCYTPSSEPRTPQCFAYDRATGASISPF